MVQSVLSIRGVSNNPLNVSIKFLKIWGAHFPSKKASTQSKQNIKLHFIEDQKSTFFSYQGWGATYPQHQRPIRGDCADNCTISAPDVTWVEKHLTQGFLPAKFFCVSRTQRTKDLNLLLFSTRLAKERDQRLQILDQGLI